MLCPKTFIQVVIEEACLLKKKPVIQQFTEERKGVFVFITKWGSIGKTLKNIYRRND
jgi:hypothetical protein